MRIVHPWTWFKHASAICIAIDFSKVVTTWVLIGAKFVVSFFYLSAYLYLLSLALYFRLFGEDVFSECDYYSHMCFIFII